MSKKSAIGLDLDFLTRVAEDPSPYQRMKLATELAAFVCNHANTKAERDAVLPIVLKLANDEAITVRRAIAQELELAPSVPPDIAFAIAADEDEIALPFLSSCPGLSDGTLVAVARIGDDARLCAIARRQNLPRHALAVLIKFGSAKVCRELLKNDKVTIPVEGYRTIMARFASVTSVCEAMRRRQDLPVEIRIKLAQINNDRVKVVLARQGWVDDSRLDELVSEAEDHTFLQIAHGLDAADLEAMVRYLSANRLLTGSLVCRAICHGEIDFVIEALTQLAGMPRRHVANVLATGNAAGLAIICEQAQLPDPCRELLQLALECGISGDGDGNAFAHELVEAAVRRGKGRMSEDLAAILALIGNFGPEEIKPITERLISSPPRAA
ncbi:DUF2336 domain-containing protein [Rhodoligotrophos defluvii]|uniref:DUF2336 domain-containing protein n=1 Tax=Rhodoligotrophos defluvii TaxID=2561934 RepID=UPI001484C9DC|nr:DUF2336 domain-containing protein [Rhodoligotrophos defluvii]